MGDVHGMKQKSKQSDALVKIKPRYVENGEGCIATQFYIVDSTCMIWISWQGASMAKYDASCHDMT